MDPRGVAFVTGASRGIGKACSVALAEAGYDVAVSARTRREGEAREHSSTVKASNTSPLPGSLEATAVLVEKTGRRALLAPADLLDAASLGAAAQHVLDTWGRVDVIVHNGRYIGPGHMDRLLDTPIELLQKQLYANAIAPLVLDQLLLPGMIERGAGVVIDITSAAGYADPPLAAGEGGWGLGYGMSKGAFQRVAGILQAEHGRDGLCFYNLSPGFIATERMAADMGKFGFVGGEPPEVVAAVVRWLATAPEAAAHAGKNIEAQFLCHELGLLPGWDGPKPNPNPITYDRSGADLEQLERALTSQS
jgi:NAD(P)-dependent dehydrogenase (short-subunit alcohol dehydrogenase family)